MDTSLSNISEAVRPAVEADLPLILELGAALHAAIRLPGTYDRASFEGFVLPLLYRGGVFVSRRGMIGGIVWPSMWNNEYLIATEGFWWAEDGHGLALVRAFEAWARSEGASEVQVGTHQAYRRKAVSRLLRGYTPREDIRVKAL